MERLYKLTMTSETFDDLVEAFEKEANAIMAHKGQDYTQGGTDRLANFRGIAKKLGVPPKMIWFVYFHKHVDALATWASGGEVKSESLESRFADARNYLLLGLGLLHEETLLKEAE
jgi:7-cyano-7-deazaguanine synthase in queuosine biosynthesis